MKNYSVYFSIVLGLIALSYSIIIKIQQPKIVYINNGEVIDKYKETEKAKEKLEEEQKEWQNNIAVLTAERDSLIALWQRESGNWTSIKTQEMTKLGQKKDDELNRYSQAVQQKATERYNTLMSPILLELDEMISGYAQENSYDIILGTASGNLVYVDRYMDITKDIIKYVNEQ